MKEKSLLRKALTRAHELAELVKNDTPVEEIASALTQTAKEITGTSSDIVTLKEAISLLSDGEEASRAKISSGIADLDAIKGGFEPGQLIVLAGRPSMGKTMLAINFARNALAHGKTVGFFSLEMSAIEIAQRLISLEASFNSNRDPGEYNMHIQAGKITTSNVVTYLERMRAQAYDVGMVIIDYLQLMSVPEKLLRSLRRDEQIGEITRELKLVAGEFSVPIVLISQLNRECERRKDARPILSDLRESGAIEQDADIVLFIYRDEVYNENTRDKGIAELKVAKYRNGKAGVTIKLLFQPEESRFRNLTFEKVEPPF